MSTIPSDNRVAKLANKADIYAPLLDDPSFKRLATEFKERKAKWFEQFGRGLMAGEEIDQRKLDFYRGYWAGITALLANPERAVREFERAAHQGKE